MNVIKSLRHGTEPESFLGARLFQVSLTYLVLNVFKGKLQKVTSYGLL